MSQPIKKLFKLSTLALALALPMIGATQAATQTAQTAAAEQRYDAIRPIFSAVHGKNGIVATEHEIASQVGLEVLKQGGNAVDAAVAVGFALAVVLPNAGNIGGGGFMMVHDAKSGESVAIDFREVAPLKGSRDMYLNEKGEVIDGKSLYTHAAVGVPGTVAGMEHALKKYGTMTLAQILEPSIRLAEEGFVVGEPLARKFKEEAENLGRFEAAKQIFFKDGEPLKTGDLLVQKDLANSLRLIAKDGAKAFYEGEIAQKIVAEMEKHGGLISMDDLKGYQIAERKPVTGEYRGHKVVTMPPPSSGGVHLVQILNIIEGDDIKAAGVNSAQNIHLTAEAMKMAYADRSEYLGDPDFVKVPVKALTSKNYAKALREQINMEKARPASEIKPGNVAPYESDQTTHYSIIDKDGNAVAVTYTLNMNFGSGIVAEGTGILLNDEMDDFSAKPGVANAFGLVGGDANAIEPKKRPLSSMTPTIVLKDGKVSMVTGSPGGARIITTVLQTIVNTIDHEMNAAEASITPRFHHQWTPDELRIEEGISPDTIKILESKGHTVKLKAPMGVVQVIHARADGYYGFSDPRNADGKTVAY